MQTFRVFVLLPAFFKASFWEPWQHSVGHPFETQWTLLTQWTTNLKCDFKTRLSGLYRKEKTFKWIQFSLTNNRGFSLCSSAEWFFHFNVSSMSSKAHRDLLKHCLTWSAFKTYFLKESSIFKISAFNNKLCSLLMKWASAKYCNTSGW